MSPDLHEFNYTRYRPKGALIAYLLLGLLILGFATFQLQNLVSGPQLSFNPDVDEDGFNTVDHNIFTLSGEVSKVAFLYINDEERPILSDETFSYDLFLPPGLSTIEVRVADRYGRTNSRSLRVNNPIAQYDEDKMDTLASRALAQYPTIQ